MTEEVIKDDANITKDDIVPSTINFSETDLMGMLNEIAEKERNEYCRVFIANWSSMIKRFPHKKLSILAFIQETVTDMRQNSGSHSIIAEFERFLNPIEASLETAHEDVEKLHPDKWFRETEKGAKFHPHDCAEDYANSFPDTKTTYEGVTTQFGGTFWYKDAEGIIKSRIEKEKILTPTQIDAAFISLQNITRVTDSAKFNLPMEDTMPLPDHTIPITDGLLNLKTKQISPHTPEYYYTEALPRKYIPGAIPTRFLELLNVMFTNDPGKNLKITQIMETFAWTFMKNYDIQGMVAMYGQGGEGKSIIHDVIGGVIVKTSSATLDELENDNFSRPDLYGSWANLISESTAKAVGSEWFKRLTDGTEIRAARKHGQPFYFRSHAKMIADVNELPAKTDETRAFYRRVIAIITFLTPLEELLTPIEIGEFVKDLKAPDELDKIFSYVVDNFYVPLTDRMKFTGQLTTNEAAKQWEQFSNPALSFLKLKMEAGLIFTDIENARAEIMRCRLDINHYITHEKNMDGDEYLTTIKQPVIMESIKWAKDKGFPAKHVDAKTLGAALTTMEYSNITCTKKIAKGVTVKAWKDIGILPFEDGLTREVTDESDHPESTVTSNLFIPQQVESHTVTDNFSIDGYIPEITDHEEKIGFIRHQSATDSVLPDQKPVTAHFSQTVTIRHLPEPESIKSSTIPDVKNENSGFKTVELVMENLEAWGFKDIKREKIRGNDWRARLQGKFETFTAEQQQYLRGMYRIMYGGSNNNPYTLVRFKVKDGDSQ